MAKLYSGGIEIATGFKVQEETLLDDKSAVETRQDLSTIRAAVGQLSFVRSDEKLYLKTTKTDWIPIVSENAENLSEITRKLSTIEKAIRVLDNIPSWVKNPEEQKIGVWSK